MTKDEGRWGKEGEGGGLKARANMAQNTSIWIERLSEGANRVYLTSIMIFISAPQDS